MNRTTVMSAAIAAMLLAGGAQAESERNDERGASAGELELTMQQAIDAAEKHAGGKANEAELEREDGAARYEVKVRTAEGTREVYVDAGDGSILSSSETRKEHSDD
jgi:uncharacterized membrane protein YkoI